MFTLRTHLLNDFYAPRKVRYKVNFPLQMAECEANYVRLKKLLPLEGNEREFAVSYGAQLWRYKINIIERSPYTITLQLMQIAKNTADSTWLQMPRLTVRMYRDAKLAEVLAWEGHKRLRPRYDYPNQSMYQCDEKLQINQFLGEWLIACLKQGHSTDKFVPTLKF